MFKQVEPLKTCGGPGALVSRCRCGGCQAPHLVRHELGVVASAEPNTRQADEQDAEVVRDLSDHEVRGAPGHEHDDLPDSQGNADCDGCPEIVVSAQEV